MVLKNGKKLYSSNFYICLAVFYNEPFENPLYENIILHVTNHDSVLPEWLCTV